MTRAKHPELLRIESLQQTIDRVVAPSLRSEVLADDLATIHAIREVVACELEKLSNHYRDQHRVIATNNLAYHLAQRAKDIREWEPTWRIVWRDPADDDRAPGHIIERLAFGEDVPDETLAREAELMREEGLDARVELS